jgi:hypothetical protein
MVLFRSQPKKFEDQLGTKVPGSAAGDQATVWPSKAKPAGRQRAAPRNRHEGARGHGAGAGRQPISVFFRLFGHRVRWPTISAAASPQKAVIRRFLASKSPRLAFSAMLRVAR